MASSENFVIAEPWTIRPTCASDSSWFSESLHRETELLTRALQQSISETDHQTLPLDDYSSPSFAEAVKPAPTGSNASGSEPDAGARPRKRNAVPVNGGGKVSKRKSRATKRSQTTFITADPANFRQMVQEVTGVRFGGAQGQFAQILKPEPQRVGGNRLPLPVVNTSSFLSNHHQESLAVAPALPGSGVVSNPSFLTGPASATVEGGGASGLDYDSCQNIFPTLESWKVV